MPKSEKILPPEVLIKDTGTEKGRGVFACRNFSEGEQVEEAPVLLIWSEFSEVPGAIKKYVFNWGKLADTEVSSAIALGFGSMYNHADPANMRYTADPDGPSLRFTAVRAIASGEELTINYNALGGGPTWKNNNWFKRMGVTPLEESDD